MTRPSSRARSARQPCSPTGSSTSLEALDVRDPRDRRRAVVRARPPTDRRPRPRAGPGRLRRARDRRHGRRPSSGSRPAACSREERERIGPLPRGHGLLGLLIHEAVTVRIPEIADHPKRYGFPPHHPPMRSFLGVPITVRGRVVGDLYLTEQARGARVQPGRPGASSRCSRCHAGIAIENARLHEEVQRLAVVEERERIGQDLHDGIIQSLYAAQPAARGRARADGRRPGRGAGQDRPGDRRPPPRHPRHPQLHLRAAPGAPRPGRAGRRPGGGGRRVPAQHDGRPRARGRRGARRRAPAGGHDPARPDRPGGAQQHRPPRQRDARPRVARIGPTGEDGRREVVLEIADNGIGLRPGRGPLRGPPRPAQHARAGGSLGGRLEVLSEPGAGTRIIVHVPRPRDA